MQIRNFTVWSTGMLAALVLAGCASVPPIDPSALPAAPPAFKEADGRWTAVAPADAQPRGTWWKAFSDPALDGLIEQATRSNTSIQLAAARLTQARALVRSAQADRSVQVGAGAGAVRQTDLRAGGAPATVISAGADLSYEVDLFGRLARTTDAAALDAQAREALLENTRLLVQANVAQTYFAIRALDTERTLVRATLVAYRDTLRLTERRFQAGDVAELDVARVTSEVAATESDALALDRARTELEHALAVLVGEVTSRFQLAAADWSLAAPVIPPGVPSTVLARRPDVSAAQRSMLAAQARVGVANAAWFPNLLLTGSAGYASPELGDLFKWSARAWSVGALLSLPILDGGRREAGVQNAQAELEAALATYREQILVAFREVEDQLSALRLLGDQAHAQARAVAAADRATVLSDSRYRNGLVSQLELLDAQRSELRNRRQALQVRSAQYQATVALIRALGGSWDAAQREGSASSLIAAGGVNR
jgi:multidrug efflux system outer membrane protein